MTYSQEKEPPLTTKYSTVITVHTDYGLTVHPVNLPMAGLKVTSSWIILVVQMVYFVP